MRVAEPAANGANGHAPLAVVEGRDPTTGRFLKGNPGGPGNPWPARVHHIRALIQEAATDEAVLAVVARMIEDAKNGDAVARREFFDRTLGKPDQAHKIVAAVADGLTPQQLGELMLGAATEGPAE